MNELDSKTESSEPAPAIEETVPVAAPPAESAPASSGSGGCGKYFAFGAGIALILVLGLLGRLVLPDLLGLTPTPAPTPTPRPPVVSVLSLRPLAELATVEFPAVADIPNERVPDDIRKHLGVKEEVLMLMYGEVKAGFDLSKLSDEDIWIDGTRVQLYLPEPEILSTSIDFDKTRIVSYEKSILVGSDPALQAETLKKGKQALEQGALESGILDMATLFGQMYFENHLRSLGFTEVKVLTKNGMIEKSKE
ncbi:MAG TPA: DUF4230 domain-containing protein [Caldilineae bacterium]|nr:DUF4230 domain-containing protein [Caldilineae bacterium]